MGQAKLNNCLIRTSAHCRNSLKLQHGQYMEISIKRRLDPGSQHGDIGRIRDRVEPVAERSLTVVIQVNQPGFSSGQFLLLR